MRAIVSAPRHVLVGFACAAALAACDDALHLYPPDGGTPDGGTTGGTPCTSAKDCAAPTPVCDPAGNVCVGCASDADCAAQPGTVCSKGTCECPTSKTGTLTYCADALACVDVQTSQTDCGSCGHACFGNCTAGACADPWEPLPTAGAPDPRSHHVAVWTGSKMFVWGGAQTPVGGGATVYLDSGGLYDPVARTWTPTSSANAPSPREDATAVYDSTDNLILVWGGTGETGVLGDGAAYNVAMNTWSAITSTSAPGPQTQHTAVWGDANGMIVFGGFDGSQTPLSDGGTYLPSSGVWGALAGTSPSARGSHSAVWTGSAMLVFGGFSMASAGPPPMSGYLNDLYSYSSAGWTSVTTMGNAPSPRADHTATWDSGSATMIVYGGVGPTMTSAAAPLQDGASVDSMGNWTVLAAGPVGLPDARSGHTAVDIDGTVYVFGGDKGSGQYLGTGGVLSLQSMTWTWTALLPTAPAPRSHHTAVVGTISKASVMLVWGGDTGAGPTNTGAVLYPTKLMQ